MTGANQPTPPTRPVGAFVLHRILYWAFQSLFFVTTRLGSWRRQNKRLYQIAVGAVIFVLTVILAPKVQPAFTQWLDLSESDPYHLAYALAHGLSHGLVAMLMALVGTLLLAVVVPFVFLSERAIAVDAIGLDFATTEGGMQEQLARYLPLQPLHRKIRVICISGHSLFGEPHDGQPRPLRIWADRGRLEVVVPRPDPTNAVICERFRTYDPAYVAEHYPAGVVDLVNEIDKGIKVLKNTAGNSVRQHDFVFLWRVVLLSRFCLVQAYFPNPRGGASDRAPVFVYEDRGQHSFYQTYEQLFEFFQRNGTDA